MAVRKLLSPGNSGGFGILAWLDVRRVAQIEHTGAWTVMRDASGTEPGES